MTKTKISESNTRLCELEELFLNLCKIDLEDKKSRLFPKGNTQNEDQTTSIFLASLSAVKEYREELISFLGEKKIKAFNAQLHTYVQIKDDDKKKPDGLIVITTGKHEPVVEWACVVESKIDNNPLDSTQIKNYIQFAKKLGINKLLTISNDLATSPGQSPVLDLVTKRELGKFKLYHWSWTYLKVTATRLIRAKAIEDEDHIFILEELRHFFDNHAKIKSFNHMGKDWGEYSRQISNSRGKKVSIKTCESIAKSFVQEEKDLALQMTDKKKLEMHIELIPTNNRINKVVNQIADNKQIVSNYIINGNKQYTFCVLTNFIEQEVICQVNVKINKGKAKAQTSNLINMLKTESGVPDKIKVRAIYKYNKTAEKCSLNELIKQQSNPTISDYSILDKSMGDTVKHFEIKIREKIGTSFFSPTKFIKKLEANTAQFLEQVMCNVKM